MVYTALDPKLPPLLLQVYSLPLLFFHAEEETPPPVGRDQRDISIRAFGHLPVAFCILSSYDTKVVLDEEELEGQSDFKIGTSVVWEPRIY